MPIRIRAKREGFRRCDLAHPADWVEHPDGRFTDDEMARLKAEPMLEIEVILAPAILSDDAVETQAGARPEKTLKLKKSRRT
jgi:hypothetical protein